MAAKHAPVWEIPTEDGRVVERKAETVNNEEVQNQRTRRLGRRLDLSLLHLHERLLLDVLRDALTCQSVTVLDLNDCGLNTLPRLISNMESLVRLRLHSNNLKTLPDTISDLNFLERLSVYGNQLESLPRSLYKLQQLKILRLGGNRLQDEDLEVIHEMAGIEELYLRQNYELTIIPREVCLMEDLAELNADDCDGLVAPPWQVITRGIDSIRRYAETHVW